MPQDTTKTEKKENKKDEEKKDGDLKEELVSFVLAEVFFLLSGNGGENFLQVFLVFENWFTLLSFIAAGGLNYVAYIYPSPLSAFSLEFIIYLGFSSSSKVTFLPS